MFEFYILDENPTIIHKKSLSIRVAVLIFPDFTFKP